MHDLFELVFEYRSLLAQRRAEGAALGLMERTRLDALHRLLGREPSDAQGTRPGDAGRRRHARCDVQLSGLLRLGKRGFAVDVQNLGAGGVCVRSPQALRIGERGVLRLTAPDTGRIYECITETTWVDDDTAGMRFIGAPLEIRLAS